MPKKNTAEGKKAQREEPRGNRVRIKLKAYDHRILDQSARLIIEAIEKTDAKVVGPIPLPAERKVYTVLRSTFVHKDSREQFEVRIHKRLIEVSSASAKTIDALTAVSLPAGVGIEVKMW